MRKTKIVATLGPASQDKNTILAMIKAGLNIARLNMSHNTQEDHKRRLEMVKSARQELSQPVAIMLDTRGPEIRLGKFENDEAYVKEGDEFVIVNKEILGNSKKACVTCEDFYKCVKPGDYVLINDGLIRMDVKEVKGENIHFKVINGGRLSNNKSINVPGVELNMPYLNEKDKKDILFGIENGVDYIAASFVSTAQDVYVLKNFLAQNNGTDIEIIAKIESKKGVDNIDEIVKAADGIMVARGDLGVEIPYELLPQIQKTLIKKARNAGKRVITATEMLESMINNPRPTRAETSDVANAVYDGTSAIMLSGETAAGKYPVQAIMTMSRIAESTENCIHYKKRFMMQDFQIESIADAISSSAVKASLDLDCSAILVVTESGKSARLVSRFRPIAPIIAITTNTKSYYKMALSWGVVPLLGSTQRSMDDLFKHATEVSRYYNLINSGDRVVTVASTQVGRSGSTNIMKIERVD